MTNENYAEQLRAVQAKLLQEREQYEATIEEQTRRAESARRKAAALLAESDYFEALINSSEFERDWVAAQLAMVEAQLGRVAAG